MNNQTSNNNFSKKSTNNSNEAWTPEEDFQEVFIRLDENNNCVISGPTAKVQELKEQISQIITEGCEPIDEEKLKSIRSFEFQVE